jgi:hypothetical protein
MAKKYVVSGEYVTVRTMTDQGPTVIGLYRGAQWPEDASKDATEHHLTEGLIKEEGDDTPAPAHLTAQTPAAPAAEAEPAAAKAAPKAGGRQP